jgi:cell wall-associated NlpC family hydrolase
MAYCKKCGKKLEKEVETVYKPKRVRIALLAGLSLLQTLLPCFAIEQQIKPEAIQNQDKETKKTKANLLTKSEISPTKPDSLNTSNLKEKIIIEAKEYLDMNYVFMGRDSKKIKQIEYNSGIDCMGLCFLSYAKVFNEDWTKYSTIPSELIKSKKLGSKIALEEDNKITEKNIKKLQKGDIIYFLINYNLSMDKNIAKINKPIVKINNQNYWSYTMAIYAGEGKIIHACPNKKKVLIEPIINFKNFPIFITRRAKKSQ